MNLDPNAISGVEAYKRHDWTEAYELLSPLLESELDQPEAIEALGSAAWWIGDIETTIDARQRAYTEYVAQGRSIDASRVAIHVAEDHIHLLQSSTANGWIKKARSLLDDNQVVAEHGHLMRLEAVLARNLEEAIELSAKVHQVGVDLGDVDLAMLGLHDGGRFMVASGELESGMAMMEEAMVSAVAGELSPMVTGRIFCNMIETCASMADYRRAIEWSDQTMRWCEGIGNAGGYPGVCRVRRAEFMRLRGDWSDAEEEARRAMRDLADIRPYMGEAFDQLGMVRLNFGDIAGAEDAFRRAHSLGSNSMPGLALVKVAQGDPVEGLSMIQAGLASAERLTVRMKLLPAAVEIALASSDLVRAAEYASELESLVERYDSEVLSAFSLQSTGRVAAACNAHEDAVPLFQKAVRILLACGLPFEAARARLDLGTALTQTGSESSGRLEIDAARSEFERLGAQFDLARLSETLLAQTAPERPQQMTTMMFTDIVQSTDLVSVIGDESWADLVSWHDRTLRSLIASNAGTEIDHAGDGFFVSFPSPEEALGCARQIQSVLERHRKEEGFSPRVRIGVHTGQALHTNEGLVGHQVHIAARVGAAGQGDEVLVTLEGIDEHSGFLFENERTIIVKGVDEPLVVASLVWKD